MATEKAIFKALSIKPHQLAEIGKHTDITRYGGFSQFVQDAIDEKLERLELKAKQTKNPQKAAS